MIALRAGVFLLLLLPLLAWSEPPLHPYRTWAESPQAENLPGQISLAIHRLMLDPEYRPCWRNLDWPAQPTGVFITAMKGRKVRACVGVLQPTEKTLGEEMWQQCRRVIHEDPRHPPLSLHELDSLRFVLTLTGAVRPMPPSVLPDIWQEGVIARWNDRSAVLLPGEARTWSWGRDFMLTQLGNPPAGEVQWYRVPVVVINQQPVPE